MKSDVVSSTVEQDGHRLLGGPDRLIVINYLHTLRFVLGLEDEEFGGAVAYGEVLFHVRLLLGLCGNQSGRYNSNSSKFKVFSRVLCKMIAGNQPLASRNQGHSYNFTMRTKGHFSGAKEKVGETTAAECKMF